MESLKEQLSEHCDKAAFGLVGLITLIIIVMTSSGEDTIGDLEDKITAHINKIEEIKIDLYSLFVEGTPQLISLRESDVITVSPIGTTVGVSGNVKRPSIYELRDEKMVDQVLRFAGGVLPSGNLQRIQIERFHENRKKVVLDVPLGEDVLGRFELFDGDLHVETRHAVSLRVG